MDYIREDKKGLKIGALTKLNSVAGSSVVREKYAVLAEAARLVASPEVRNMGTIGAISPRRYAAGITDILTNLAELSAASERVELSATPWSLIKIL